MSKVWMNLHWFDGAGDGAAASGAAPAAGSDGASGGATETPSATPKSTVDRQPTKRERNPLANVVYGKQPDAQEQQAAAPTAQQAAPGETEANRRADFDQYIRDHKDLYDERVQRAIQDRFKGQKEIQGKADKMDALQPVLEMLAGKYGVDAADVEGLSKAIQADDSYYEQEAMDKGLTVQQLKQMKQLERENAEFKRAAQERERQANAQKVYQQWVDQAEEAKRFYPDFDLKSECSAETGERFLRLLRSGVDVRTAYEVVHRDDIIGGAMARAAATAQKKTIDGIRSRGLRPVENGVDVGAPARIVKSDPSKWTKKDREEISRRVMRGERIEL